MKRGLISWDKGALPASVFDARLGKLRKALAERDLPAAVVYCEIWRANQVRFLSNLMLYWNRALLVVPRQQPPILICGLSPRVYPWIRSVTVLEDIRPNNNPARGVLQLCSESQWKRIGVLDLPQVPHDIHSAFLASPIAVENIASETLPEFCADEPEISMRRRAAALGRRIVAEEMPKGAGTLDYHFVGRLERTFRRAGAEDLVVLLSNGDSAPRPARGVTLGGGFSLSVAMEYRGHWVKLVRTQAAEASLTKRSESLFKDWNSPTDFPVRTEMLSGSYPYESCDRSQITRGDIFALTVESSVGGHRAFYGDTCWWGPNGVELL